MSHTQTAPISTYSATGSATTWPEQCHGCFLDSSGAHRGPCKQSKGAATVAQLAPGTLVHVEPATDTPGHVPGGAGVVLRPYGADAQTSTMVVVWTGTEREPVAGDNVHAYYPAELTPLRHTLTTLPAPIFRGLAYLARQANDTPGHAELWDAIKTAAVNRI